MLVDAFTAVGGSQYVDSPGIGNYHTYLCDELVPFVDANYPTLPDAAHRGIQGKSSGGYGSMITPLLRPDLFGGLATHAGDALFEVCYARDFAPAARALRERTAARSTRSGRTSARAVPCSRHRTTSCSSTPMRCAPRTRRATTVRSTCRSTSRRASAIDEVWQRWLRFDPVAARARAAARGDAARTCAAIWIDSGRNDEYHLELGATAFHREVVAAGTPEDRVHFELFPGTHRGLTWRYPLSLAWLVERLRT